MRRLTDETAPLLPHQVDIVVVQNRQSMKPGVLNPLYSVFSAISCISQFLSVETLLSFRLTNLQLNEASEKAFLYWISLKILRDLSKISDGANGLNIIIPRYFRCYTIKTIDLHPDFKNRISALNNMNVAGQLFLSQAAEPTIELAKMQKRFIQLCNDIGSAPEGEFRWCHFKELTWAMMMSSMLLILFAAGCGMLTDGVMFYKEKTQDSVIFGTLMSVGALVFFAMAALIIKVNDVHNLFCPEIPADIYEGPQLVLSSSSARLFKRIADTVQTVSVPVDWMERLSK